MRGPERLFESDPDLARIRAMLDRDEPPSGALERAAQRVALAERPAARTTLGAGADRLSPSFKLWVVVGIGVLAVLGAGVASSVWMSKTGLGVSPSPVRPSLVAPPSIPLAPPASDSAQRAIRVEDLPTALPGPTGPPTERTSSIDEVRVEDEKRAAPRAPAEEGSAFEKVSPTGKTSIADPFLEELALVEQARGALAKGRGLECIEAVKAYEKRFTKGGVFREEVEVMRIEALAMAGDHAQAQARGRRVLETHRETPYAERIRRVLGQSAE